MRISEKTNLYEQHLGIIYERAIAFHATTGIPTEDFLSEGDLIFMETVKTWNRNAAKFSTWLYRNLNQRFYKLAGKEKKYQQLFEYDADGISEIVEHQREFDPVANICFKEMLNSLSKEAQYVAHIILTAPNEILDIASPPKPPKMVRGILSQYLQKKGWSYKVVLKSFKEIKEALNEKTNNQNARFKH